MERVTLVRDNSEVNRILGMRATSPGNESLPPMLPQKAQPSKERLLVLREGPGIENETPDESGDSELEEGEHDGSAFPLSKTPPLSSPVTQLSTPTPPGDDRDPSIDLTSHSPLSWHSLICDKVGRNHCCLVEDEDSNRMRAKTEYVPVTEVESLTNKRNRRNGDLGRGYESTESLTEKMSRELVVKEAKRLELEKRAQEA